MAVAANKTLLLLRSVLLNKPAFIPHHSTTIMRKSCAFNQTTEHPNVGCVLQPLRAFKSSCAFKFSSPFTAGERDDKIASTRHGRASANLGEASQALRKQTSTHALEIQTELQHHRNDMTPSANMSTMMWCRLDAPSSALVDPTVMRCARSYRLGRSYPSLGQPHLASV